MNSFMRQLSIFHDQTTSNGSRDSVVKIMVHEFYFMRAPNGFSSHQNRARTSTIRYELWCAGVIIHLIKIMPISQSFIVFKRQNFKRGEKISDRLRNIFEFKKKSTIDKPYKMGKISTVVRKMKYEWTQ